MIKLFEGGKFCMCIFLIIFFTNGIVYSAAEIKFEEATENLGTRYSGDTYGSSWGDFNGDGLPDLFLGHHINFRKEIKAGAPNLFQNNGNGTFTDVSSLVGLGLNLVYERDLHGAAWADFDNDGDQDLIILVGAEGGKGQGPNAFLINNGGTFKERAAEFGLDYPLARGRMPLWFDYDNDGLLDLVLANSARRDAQAPTAIFHQTSGGFRDVTSSTGLKIENAWFLQISDLSLDNKMELVFLSPVPEAIYDIRNLPFQNLLENLGLNVTKQKPDDFVIADFNGDLASDIFMTLSRPHTVQFQLDKLLINTNSGFEDQASLWNLNNPTACKAVAAGDFDNDMDLDIFLACATWEKFRTLLTDQNIPNILYENLGNGTFKEVPNAGGANGTNRGAAESVSVADYDVDGFLDLFVTNSHANQGPVQLFKNVGNDNNWIEIDLVGSVSNRDGIGSKVLINSGDKTQLREQSGGIHFRAQNYQRLHVGLGNNTVVDDIVVFWPSGIVHKVKNPPINQVLQIVEPSTPIAPLKQQALGLEPSEIKCKKGLKLISRSIQDDLACVKPSTIPRLIERGLSANVIN